MMITSEAEGVLTVVDGNEGTLGGTGDAIDVGRGCVLERGYAFGACQQFLRTHSPFTGRLIGRHR